MIIISPEVIVNKRVLVRLDLDLPCDDNGTPTETTRIDVAMPTLQLLKDNAKQVIFCGHLGRPKGKLQATLSLKKLLPLLEERVGSSIAFEDLYLAKEVSDHEPTDRFVLLENLRFFAGEEENDPVFSQKLARLADIFINEAFGVAHRTAASTVGVAKLLTAFAGMHFAEEVVELSTILHNPLRPFILVLGGAKLETKLPIITQLTDSAEAILVGGLLAKDLAQAGGTIAENVIVAEMTGDGEDLSQASIDRFTTILSKAQTVVWNGPVGKAEDPKHAAGTKAMAQAIIDSGAYSIVGGGDTLGVLHTLGFLEKFDFVSVGGGAMLAFLSGCELPALAALRKP